MYLCRMKNRIRVFPTIDKEFITYIIVIKKNGKFTKLDTKVDTNDPPFFNANINIKILNYFLSLEEIILFTIAYQTLEMMWNYGYPP